MSSEENKALALRSHSEVFNQDNLDVADEIFAPDFVWHSPGLPPEASHGPEGVKYFARLLRSAFPDYELTEDDTIAEGDRVVNRWTMRGTHEGEFLGIPPTVKQGDSNRHRHLPDRQWEDCGNLAELGPTGLPATAWCHPFSRVTARHAGRSNATLRSRSTGRSSSTPRKLGFGFGRMARVRGPSAKRHSRALGALAEDSGHRAARELRSALRQSVPK